MKTLRKLVDWISDGLENVDELAPRAVERRSTIERRKLCVGYEGIERRSGQDRRDTAQ